MSGADSDVGDERRAEPAKPAKQAEQAEQSERAELVGRVIDLEVRAAFQAQTIEALDGVLREFAARVEVLERQVRELAARPGERELGRPEDEPPSWV